MHSIEISRKAKKDLQNIHLYIAQHNPVAANNLIETIIKKIQHLAENPFIGVKRNDIQTGLRMSVTGSYITLYRVSKTTIKITRVIHGARDFSHL